MSSYTMRDEQREGRIKVRWLKTRDQVLITWAAIVGLGLSLICIVALIFMIDKQASLDNELQQLKLDMRSERNNRIFKEVMGDRIP